MKVRYSVNDAGELVDRDGQSLGRLTSLTLEQAPDKEGRGDYRGEGTLSFDVDVPPTTKEPHSPHDSRVLQVWDYYQHTIPNAQRQQLNAQRRRHIERALKIRSADECCKAIIGLSKSPYHNGQNDQGTKYLDIRYALHGNVQKGESDEERIDRMAELATAPGLGRESEIPDVLMGRVNDLKTDVLRGWHEDGYPPPTEDALLRAKRAAQTLRDEFGIDVGAAPNGRPVFA